MPRGTRYSAAVPKPPPGKLREHAHVGHGSLARHHDEIVTPVAAHVGCLEIVVAGVLYGVHDGRLQAARAVVQQQAHRIRSPADAGDVETSVTVELPETDLVAVRGGGQGRRPERSRHELRKHLHALTVEADHDIGAAVSRDVSDPDRLRAPAGQVRNGRGERAVRLLGEDEDVKIVERIEVVARREHDVVSAVARNVADRHGLRPRAHPGRLVGLEESPERRREEFVGGRTLARRVDRGHRVVVRRPADGGRVDVRVDAPDRREQLLAAAHGSAVDLEAGYRRAAVRCGCGPCEADAVRSRCRRRQGRRAGRRRAGRGHRELVRARALAALVERRNLVEVGDALDDRPVRVCGGGGGDVGERRLSAARGAAPDAITRDRRARGRRIPREADALGHGHGRGQRRRRRR